MGNIWWLRVSKIDDVVAGTAAGAGAGMISHSCNGRADYTGRSGTKCPAPALHGCVCGRFGAKPRARSDGGEHDKALDHEAGGKHHEQPAERSGEAKRQPAAAKRDEHAQEAGGQRPEQFSGALRREVERKTEAKKSVEWPDHAQVGTAGLDHARLGAEQREPGARPDGGG